MTENGATIRRPSVDPRLLRANDVLAELCRAIVKTEDAAGVARDAAARLQRHFGTASVGIWWVEGERLRLEGLALSDRCEPRLEDRIREEYASISRHSNLPGVRAIEERRILRFGVESTKLPPDVRNVLRAADSEVLLCIPVYVDGDPVGVGLVAAPRKQPLTAVDESLLESALGVLGVVYHRARLQERDDERKRRALAAYELAVVGELAAGVAHEVNNPLSAITGLAEILTDRDDVPADVRDDADVIRAEALRAGEALRQLTAFAPRNAPEEAGPVDLRSVVESVLLLHARRNELAGVEVEVHGDAGVSPISGRRSELQQTVHNLVANARRMIESHDDRGRIVVRLEDTGSRVELVIRDTGPGIPRRHLEHIFDPFFSTRDQDRATGLGLATVHEVVREHRGVVSAENWGLPRVSGGERGEGGARFVVRLPVTDDGDDGPGPSGHEPAAGAEPGRPSQAPAHPSARRPPLVLLVEDDEPVAASVRRLLERAGYRTRTAATAEEALDDLRGPEEEPDLILSDIRMPGMGGQGLHTELSSRRPELLDRLIFASGDLVSPETRSFAAGIDRPVLAKPFSLDELRGTLERVLAPARR